MKERKIRILGATVVGAFISFLLFAIVIFIFVANPIAATLFIHPKLTIIILTLVLPIGGFFAGKITKNGKDGLFAGIFAGIGFLIFSYILIAVIFHWDYTVIFALFYEGVGIDSSTIDTGNINAAYKIIFSAAISLIFAILNIISNIFSGFLGGKLKEE